MSFRIYRNCLSEEISKSNFFMSDLGAKVKNLTLRSCSKFHKLSLKKKTNKRKHRNRFKVQDCSLLCAAQDKPQNPRAAFKRALCLYDNLYNLQCFTALDGRDASRAVRRAEVADEMRNVRNVRIDRSDSSCCNDRGGTRVPIAIGAAGERFRRARARSRTDAVR